MRWPVVVALTLVWLLLWGGLTPWLVIGGVVAAVVALAIFPFPDTGWRWRLRPWPFLVLVTVFARDLVGASVQVAWLAVRPHAPPPGAIIRVRLTCTSDLLTTITAELVSLVPGSLLIELDDTCGDLVLHVLDASTPQKIADARASVLAQEARVVQALGCSRELGAYREASA